MENKAGAIFQFYRYQILPTSKIIQMSFEPKIQTMEELVKRKNEFFQKALNEIKQFEFPRAELNHMVVASKNDVSILRLGVNRGIKRTKKDFTDERMENWPNSLIVINNKANIQKIAIQHNLRVFSSVKVIADILESNFNKHLARYQLSAVLEPIFEEKVFWDIMKQNKNKVTVVDFELVTPNLSNISRSISEELKDLQKGTNTQKTNIKLQSDKNSSLDIEENNSLVKDLVEYASKGGGNIRCKIRGHKRYVNAAKGIKQESVDLIEIENINQIENTMPEIAKE